SLYRSSPMGPADQPDFINAVVKAVTGFSALDLLDRLQAIEQQMGRVRDGQRWGPRVIDLDLLLFGSETIATPRLTVPHYGLAERAFVLVPLAEINPGLMIPGQGALQGLLERTDSAMIEALEKL
ncbi:MAG: 2-amino-4-hydroxy-6-hydroxymethyldihydropteridine diphosphokinase, partial [Gammaproteobacteria bacterium]|nr:2-amino-4-hydroxy-6-hydroxymethyldihydropteridine diphosphokinase [Gammaproteobacteria bacterium]